MTDTSRAALEAQLIRHEGMRLKPYRDSVGKLTIGVGRNLDDVGVSREEVMFMLGNDITKHVSECVVAFPWFEAMDEIRQRAVADLCFNMGLTKLLTFKNTLKCFALGDYDAAADNLMLSRWFSQVGSRGPRIVHMVRTGTEPPTEGS